MSLNKRTARQVLKVLREAARGYNFADKNFIKIIEKHSNPYKMLQEVNYSGRFNDTESLIVSRVFLHIDTTAKQVDPEKREDRLEELIAVFKCLLTSLKSRETQTGSLFMDTDKDAEWDMVEVEESNDYVMIDEDLGA